MSRFADLHCHPHMRSFNWFRVRPDWGISKKYHPWYVVYTNQDKAVKGGRAFTYSQSDLIKLKNGNVKLAFVSLYPMEKGWFTNADMGYKKRLKTVIAHPIQSFKDKSRIIINPTSSSKKDEDLLTFLRGILQSTIMQIPVKRTNFLKSNYNYFEELKKERDFVLERNDKETSSDIFIPPLRKEKLAKKDIEENTEFYKADGTYAVASDFDHLDQIISDDKIAVVLTIEGSNVLNSFESKEDIRQNIETMRGWNPPVFFISLAHHFDNGLCGHAHSIPDFPALIINQKDRMDRGFDVDEDKGWFVVRELLNLDDNFRPKENGKRPILIDVKHMNAISRMQYYTTIIKLNLNSDNPIPVVASHCGYSGKKTLVELMHKMYKENNKYREHINGVAFNAWNINLCDEDIRLIYSSRGIIGISFDQRILGVERKNKKKDDHFDILWNNLKAMVSVVLNSPPEKLNNRNPKNGWDLFGIGTDFDGYIDPANGYATALNFKEFRKKLIQRLENEPNLCLDGLKPKEIADKVCYENAYNFTLNNFK